MKIRKDTIRKLYRDAIVQVFGCGEKDLDQDLLKAIKADVHYGADAPGQWSPSSVLEIYCESGIPNATDINDFGAEAIEFGFDPSEAVCYNSDRWAEVDNLVNLYLEAVGHSERFYHEPCNAAVVNIARQ
jgi:hypothetical protein